MNRSFHIQTFGCQMNANDSDWLVRSLTALGFVENGFADASIYIINTCSVRDKPEQKVYSELGRIARFCKVHGRSDVMVCVGGCVAQQAGPSLIRRFPQVRLLFGPDGISRVPGAITRLTEEPGLRLSLLEFADHYEERPSAWPWRLPPPVSGTDALPWRERAAGKAPASAFVTIMQGCDNFCAYCIVPFVRGRQKSRRPGAILEECRALLDGGAREITLLGQNVNSYGQDGKTADDTPSGENGRGFTDLLYAVAALPGIERLRFVTSHPKDLAPKVIDAFAGIKALCPRLHLPLQSGADSILKAMNRRYDTAGYLDMVRRLRNARPDITLTTDIIVGFPGESEEDFQATMDMMQTVGFASSFSFVYSDRPGTRALLLPGKVDRATALDRLSRLQEWQNQASTRILESMKGKTVDVLIEGRSRRDTLTDETCDVAGDEPAVQETPKPGEPGLGPQPATAKRAANTDEAWQGKTPQGFIVNVPLASCSGGNSRLDGWEGAMVPVCIEAAARHSLKGRQAGAPW